ncbi:MAG TPA: hypothetical protein VGR11_13075 [Solirubrobacteraceae bacterium]|nr:hypothetical protein [Solirubrobacteraceae bacterium]
MASTTVKLQNGEKIETDEDPQALADRFDAARRDGTLIKLDTERGMVWINPHVLLTIAPAPQYRSANL